MSEADQELARDPGFLEAYTIGLGTMIGFGQYLLPGLGQYVGALAGWGDIGITVAALIMAAV